MPSWSKRRTTSRSVDADDAGDRSTSARSRPFPSRARRASSRGDSPSWDRPSWRRRTTSSEPRPAHSSLSCPGTGRTSTRRPLAFAPDCATLPSSWSPTAHTCASGTWSRSSPSPTRPSSCPSKVRLLCCLSSIASFPSAVGFVRGDGLVRRHLIIFWLDTIVDALFVKDIAVQFALAYYDDSLGGMLVRSHARIASRYFRTWFLVDVVSVLPVQVVSAYLSKRATRLVSLLKLLSSRASFDSIDCSLDGSRKSLFVRHPLDLQVMSCPLARRALDGALFPRRPTTREQLLSAGCLQACAWGMTYTMTDKGKWTWVAALKYEREDKFKSNDSENEFVSTFDDNSLLHLYTASLYFSHLLARLDRVRRHSRHESRRDDRRLLHARLRLDLLGNDDWKLLRTPFNDRRTHRQVEAVDGRAQHDDERTVRLHVSLDCTCSPSLGHRGYPMQLRERCRMYFRNARRHHRLRNYKHLELHMSQSLRAEAAFANNGAWMEQVWYLKGAGASFIADLSQKLEARACAPLERISVPDTLAILMHGVAAINGCPRGKGTIWGIEFVPRVTEPHRSERRRPRERAHLR